MVSDLDGKNSPIKSTSQEWVENSDESDYLTKIINLKEKQHLRLYQINIMKKEYRKICKNKKKIKFYKVYSKLRKV